MHILISNDDGIQAEGIRCLWTELAKVADKITVVAPDRERSAMSQALTLNLPLRAEKYHVDITNVEAWQVNGTPADCTKLAMEQILLEKPDFIVTGINHGPNLASDIRYSGTAAAAIEGVIYNVPAIAMSLVTCGGEYNYFLTAAKFAAELINKLGSEKLYDKFLLNVNVPNLPDEKLGNVIVSKMGRIKYQNIFDKRTDPRGKDYYWLSGTLCFDVSNDEDADFAVVQAGNISVMPMQVDFTAYDKREFISNILKK